MSNRKIIQITSEDYMNIIEGALSGLTGGAMLGAAFGLSGAIAGALLGALITGYDAYKTTLKNIRASEVGKMLPEH